MTTATDEWQRIFDIFKLNWCRGCDEYDDYHQHGYMVGKTMHWSDRRVTRAGIYKLLKKLAYSKNGYHAFPLWRQLYLTNHDVLEASAQIGIRLPREVFDLDRARLRYALSEYTEAERRRMTPSEQTDFKAAIRWAARS